MGRLVALTLLLLLSALVLSPTARAADDPDWVISGGHFYTQAAGSGPQGFGIVDDDVARFWSEYRRLGGPSALGYPMSRRFLLDGVPAQAMEHAVLRWLPAEGRAEVVDVLDRLHAAGLDDWLWSTWLTPPQQSFDDSEQGLDPSTLVLRREGMLDVVPAIKARYLSAADPLELYGLPTAPPADVGPALVARFQRAVLQLWLQDQPGARAGEVTLVPVGKIARDAGLIPAEALVPEEAPPPATGGLVGLLLAPADLPPEFVNLDGFPTNAAAPRLWVNYHSDRFFDGPFGLEHGLAVFSAPGPAADALAILAHSDLGDPVDAPLVGDEAIAFTTLDPRPESDALGYLLVWRHGRVVSWLASAGFQPADPISPANRLAASLDARLVDADLSGITPVDRPLVLNYEAVFAERPVPWAVAHTSMANSVADRTHNVLLAASFIHNQVIPPDAIFSLNATVGPTTVERGFRMGYAILGEDTVPDIGGGICQVATTLFQAVFYGGLRVEERVPHAYWIARYGTPGLDATVSEWVDLKFANDTGGRVLIQASSDDEQLYVALYGEAPRREVRVEGPIIVEKIPTDPTPIERYDPRAPAGQRVQVEAAQDGMRVLMRRVVLEGGQELFRGELRSDYRPAHNVVVIGGTPPTPSPTAAAAAATPGALPGATATAVAEASPTPASPASRRARQR